MESCFASPDDGLEMRGRTEAGEVIDVDYTSDAPRDRTLQVTDGDRIVLDGNATDGVEDPSLDIREDGAFTGTATFRSTDGSEVQGELSGAC